MDNVYTVKVDTKPYDDLELYSRTTFNLKPGINSLVGCNGSGKTTFIDIFLKDQLIKDKIEYYKYNDRQQGGSILMDRMLNVDDDIYGVARMYMSSEGERIVCGLEQMIMSLRSFFNKNKSKPAFLLLDAIDSGMSVDEISEIRDMFLDTVIPDAKNAFDVDLYIVVAANNYEWCSDDRIHNINITNGSELKFTNYEDYKNYILKSRQTKDKLRGNA